MNTMRTTFWVLAIALSTAAAADAGPLSVVNVNAPAYNFVFSPSGSVVVNDTVDTFAVAGAAGLARLQSRVAVGQAGSPAAGRYRFSYRLSLADVYGLTFIPCIKTMKISFGPVVSSLDYNGDSTTGDQVFVVTSGGLGSVGLTSAVQSGSTITFTFASGGVCAGSSPGDGESSYFFGLVSTRVPKFVTATVTDGAATSYSPQARAPKWLQVMASDQLFAVFAGRAAAAETAAVTLTVDAVDGGRFAGTLLIQAGANREAVSIPVHGALSRDGHLQFTGRTRRAHVLVSAVEDDNDGVFLGRYRLVLADGSANEGAATLSADPRLIPQLGVER